MKPTILRKMESETMKALYTTTVQVAGGRNGHARSDDGQLDIGLAFPKALGGSGAGSNPEQLFAAGFGACFTSSLAAAARSQGLDPGEVAVDATAGLVVDDQGAYHVRAELVAALPGVDPALRESVVAEAKRICAYSNATRGNVELIVRLA